MIDNNMTDNNIIGNIGLNNFGLDKNLLTFRDSDTEENCYLEFKMKGVESTNSKCNHSVTVPKLFFVLSRITEIFSAVMIPTFVIMTVLFTFVFMLTDLTIKSAMVVGIPIQFLIMFGMGYFYVDDLTVINYDIPSLNDMRLALIGVVALTVLNTVSEFILSSAGLSVGKNQLVSAVESNPELIFVVIPAMFLFVAPVEEFVFRGVIQGFVRKYYNVNRGVLIGALYFGFVHVVSIASFGIGTLLYLIIATMLGVILGYLYEETDNLIVPIIAHAVYNSILFITIVI